MITDKGLQRFTAALVGLILGQLAGSNSVILARVWLWLLDGDSGYKSDRVAESSLHVILIIAIVYAWFGAWAARRGWASWGQVVTSILIAVVILGLSIVDQSLPPVPQAETPLPFREPLYYLGWIVGLWIVPFVLLSLRNRGDAPWFQRVGGFLCVTAAMGGVGLAMGFLVEFVVETLAEAFQLTTDMQRSWVARPLTLNAIGGSYVVVAFISIWWRGVWSTNAGACVWTLCTIALTCGYAGLYCEFYCANESSTAVWCALAFGSLPLVTGVGVLVSYGLARRNEDAVLWPVSGLFWWFLPLSLAIGYSSVAGLGLVPASHGSNAPAWVVVIAHAFNGACFGLALRAMPCAFRLMSNR